MYGTTMKHYGANRASGIKDAKKSLFSKKAKKVKKAEEKTVKKGLNMEFSLELDKEEYKLFVDIVGIQEG